MILFPFAIAAGSLIALLRVGNFESWKSARIRFPAALAGSAVLVILADMTSLPGAVGFVIVGLILFMIALGQNIHLPGVITLGIGLALNLIVMILNGHIPVRLESLIGAGEAAEGADPGSVELSSIRQLETADTNLAFLGDIVPIGLLNTVVSFGDLIAAAGLIVISYRILSRKAGAVDLDELFGGPEIDLREPQVRRTQDRRQQRPAPSISGRTAAPSTRPGNRGEAAPARRMVRQPTESLIQSAQGQPNHRSSLDKANGVGNVRPRAKRP